MQTIVFRLPLEEMLARLRQSLTDAGLLLVQERDYPAALLTADRPLRHLLVLDPATVGQVAAHDPAHLPAALLLLLVQSQGATRTALAWDEPLTTAAPTPAPTPAAAAAQAALQRQFHAVLADLRYEAMVLGLAANPTNEEW